MSSIISLLTKTVDNLNFLNQIHNDEHFVGIVNKLSGKSESESLHYFFERGLFKFFDEQLEIGRFLNRTNIKSIFENKETDDTTKMKLFLGRFAIHIYDNIFNDIVGQFITVDKQQFVTSFTNLNIENLEGCPLEPTHIYNTAIKKFAIQMVEFVEVFYIPIKVINLGSFDDCYSVADQMKQMFELVDTILNYDSPNRPNPPNPPSSNKRTNSDNSDQSSKRRKTDDKNDKNESTNKRPNRDDSTNPSKKRKT